jgi:putative ABC transport system substrate-binding protein
MRRREFITLLSGAIASSAIVARAEQIQRKARIGALIFPAENDSLARDSATAFEQTLDKLGWTVGRNVEVEYRWHVGNPASAATAITQLLAQAPDLILADSVSAAQAAQRATHTIPIVFTRVSDPIGLGLVASYSHPGGNITGFTNFEPDIAGKWLELLKQIAPTITDAGIVFKPSSTSISTQFVQVAKDASGRLALQTIAAPVETVEDIDNIGIKYTRDSGFGFVVLPDTFLGIQRARLIAMAARYRLPVIYPFRFYAVEGGLISYGPDRPDQFRHAAEYIDRIFHGTKPNELPVQRPTKFELVINQKTAKALGLSVPSTLLATADDVIE